MVVSFALGASCGSALRLVDELSLSSLQEKYGASSSARNAVVGAFKPYGVNASVDVTHLRVSVLHGDPRLRHRIRPRLAAGQPDHPAAASLKPAITRARRAQR
jgi:hypothetical protein